MNWPAFDRDQFDGLLMRGFHGRLSDDEQTGLESILRDSAEARRMYGQWMTEAVILRRWANCQPAAQAAEQNEQRIPHATLAKVYRVWLTPQVYAFAAALAIAAVSIAFYFVARPSPTDHRIAKPDAYMMPGVATLTDTQDAKFDGETPQLGSALPSGPIRLASGKAQILFASDAVVELSGPCHFELTGENHGKLIAGTLEAYVPEKAHGFTVDLPDGARVVDLGTRYMVRAVTGEPSCIRVMEGSVRVSRRDDGESMDMIAGSTIRVSPDRPLALDQSIQFSMSLVDRTLTFVQAQPFDINGFPGNTVRADDPTRPWSSTSLDANDGLWRRRSVSTFWPDFAERAGAEGFDFELIHDDNVKAPELITSVLGLSPGRYEVYIVTASVNHELWAVRADLNGPAVKPRSRRSAIDASPFPEGVSVVPIGTTDAAATRFDVHVRGEPAAVRSQYIGVAYRRIDDLNRPENRAIEP
ncbi:MAG: hypothetical protein GC162_16215 [Planctomycetes bacterium]|nr:hypothetical protein [Planctomycetota bacterium]